MLAALATVGCSMDIWDVDVDLPPATVSADFGTLQGTVPAVACDASAADPCSVANMIVAAIGDLPIATGVDTHIAAKCDVQRSQCFAEADARMAVTVDALHGDDFATKVARRGVRFVHAIDVRYVVPSNTLTFDLPAIDVYVGPPGTHLETDPGVAAAGKLGPLRAGTPLAQMGHLVVADGTAAHGLIQNSVHGKTPFVLLVVCAPHLDAGARLPAGALQVQLLPRVTLGL